MSTPGYCLHRCSCPSDANCPHFSCGCEDEHWRESCPHVTPCDTATECERRAEECACVEPHEDPKHCAPWLKEHDGEPKETDE